MIIKEIILCTKNIDAAKQFYHDQLGLKIKQASQEFVSFAAGFSILSFQLVYEFDPFYHIAFSIPNNKLDEALEWMRKRAEIFPYSPSSDIADFTSWNAKAFYFHDLQQNILELITHFDRNSYVDKPFSTALIEGICEIGIVVDDVKNACENIRSNCGLSYFVKGPVMHDFAVMGDNRGLFIISKKGRAWLPTQRLSQYFPLKALIDYNNKKVSFDF